MTTQQAEKERIAKRDWAIAQSSNLVTALHKAKELDWKNKKVQVRAETINGVETFIVEPYEQGCGCRNILRYNDYFD